MSSISAQGVVERASAELSKRINGLGLRSKHHHGSSSGSDSASSNSTSSATSSSGKTSVMERVTNALCGGGNSNSNSNSNSSSNSNSNPNSNSNSSTSGVAGTVINPQTPDKPSRGSQSSTPSATLISLSGAQPQAQQLASVNVNPTTHNPAHLMQQQQQQQQQQQLQAMAGSTLINSNHHMVMAGGGVPAPPGGMPPLGAPPTPTVKSIAKQMNITIPAPGSPTFSTMGMVAAQKATAGGGGTPLQMRKQLPNPHLHHPYGVVVVAAQSVPGSAQSNQLAAAVNQSALILHKHPPHPPHIQSIDALLLDDRFLNRFFQYFSPYERRVLAQVCIKWRDILYRSPRYWSGLLPTLQCRELRQMPACDRGKLYTSLIRRGFHALGLVGASDEDALDVVHSFPLASKHVHSLSLRCSSISDRGLETLLDHLQSLFELELAGCNEVTEAGLWACLTPRIVSLSLADCINIADEAVGAVAQLLPSLYEFSLQAYHVTDAALGYFSPKQSHSLSILRLQSCWELTNHGIVNIVHSLPHLTVLSLSGCSKLTDDGVELIAENLQKLRALDLSWCPRITDASLEYIACDLNQLEELTLDRCVHITDIGVGYISTMLSLTALFLRWCSQVRDFGLQHLCSMRNLQVLSLAGCPLLTSSGLSSLIQLRHLQELELTNCPGASHELFDYLKEHLPRCLIIE
ncbi:F-box/LRR-repeat protein 16 [Drosophila novamexicana]|uniref:F-box/LRR-repeat protein 16 n=1 Tax=Drosophila novamexicana TaxID=47314 RepID=UPI0011E5A2FF|nr:F-box/LRR-repeat protein 16 [Drosophila novamexicana]XP_030565428.1 F-box/LRR-repeat protein 16 [Drosophila novamexicana]XP_030565432.1 F-box/LRR-repeat protein 16 [Drosophila novamexicana]XP_030565440.1 F-box/LRR-repeat protein 16 [Drosophila novamexicana]XP_030565448.1 F-box/LRR-repeat protein 16 [Drosophila novamexicana]XP_030565456.1 F-box/LRR-repeat protein 16 [Drosophila novamexicana]XP_030565465.1 F-box/LRR-repeat protein 16 [Drosophila novamexicana]